jgi:hypothetical protein
MGNKLERLKQCVTDQSDVDFYLPFPHPLNALEEEFRVYPFMTTGPYSPFSDTSSPIFLTAFSIMMLGNDLALLSHIDIA